MVKLLNKIQWNRKTRYLPYQEWSQDYLSNLRRTVSTSPWRTQTHIQPATGLLNDPCAFNYYNGKWHLFYQQYPYGPVHGLKSWKHLTSTNLIDWSDTTDDLLPGTEYDSHGAYTGSGYIDDGKLNLMYTGNVRRPDWNRHSYQISASMNKNNQITKYKTPSIENAPAGYTSEFRDPYTFKYENSFYCLVGSQTEDKVGALLLYKRDNLNAWKFQGKINLPDSITGFMIECPNISFVDGYVVLTFCPQGLDKNKLNYDNIYPNIAVIAEGINLENQKLIGKTTFQLIDYGFDFYASRTTVTPDDQHLMISWLGLPELNYPTDKYGWAHCLSYVRSMHVENHHLYLYPCNEITGLRINNQNDTPVLSEKEPNVYTLDNLTGATEISFLTALNKSSTLEISSHNDCSLKIILDNQNGTVTVLRHSPDAQVETRTTQFKVKENIEMRLFIDESVFECFIDKGYVNLSGRFFPSSSPNSITLTSDSKNPKLKSWNLRRSNKEL